MPRSRRDHRVNRTNVTGLVHPHCRCRSPQAASGSEVMLIGLRSRCPISEIYVQHIDLKDVPMRYTERIDLAVRVAARAHRNQVRKSDGTPYIAHPVAVALLVSEYTPDEDIQIAALLHDVLEDADPEIYDAERLKADFGPRVLELVQGVSEKKTAGTAKAPWRVRKQAYLDHLEQTPEGCLFISAADKTHNIESMPADVGTRGEEYWGNFNAGAQEQVWFYTSVCDVIAARLGEVEAVHRYRRALTRFDALGSARS